MNKISAFTCATLLLVSTSSVAAFPAGSIDKLIILKDLAQMCEDTPKICNDDFFGAGNGGGNEPPYTPRKPKNKKPKKNKEDKSKIR